MPKHLELHILHPGLQTLIQDQGRLGYQDMGVPIGGPMDRASASLANQLVENPENTPVLEMALMGPKIKFKGNCQIALAGADLSAKINGMDIARFETIDVASDSILSFGRPQQGCRAYLAIRGKWLVPQWLGSHCAFVQAGFELPKGSLIRKGNVIHISPFPPTLPFQLASTLFSDYPSRICVRVQPGPEFNLFSSYSIGHFFSRSHELSSESNRMGYKLLSSVIGIEEKITIISSGVVPGTIQITHSGQPIILMVDSQTTGGYPRIAHVISEDLDKLGQLQPGQEVRFELW